MNLQPYGIQTAAGDEDLRHLTDFFAAQQLVTREVDDLALRESQKTLEVFQEAISASKAETQSLMLENAALRERLAAMESQKQKLELLHAAEKKAIEARSAEEIAGLKETCSTSKLLLRDLITHKQEADDAFLGCAIEFYSGSQGEATKNHVEAGYRVLRTIEKCEVFLKK